MHVVGFGLCGRKKAQNILPRTFELADMILATDTVKPPYNNMLGEELDYGYRHYIVILIALRKYPQVQRMTKYWPI